MRKIALFAGALALLSSGASAGGYSNGPSGGGSPGGSNGQVQYNNSGAFGGITGVTTDGTVLSFGTGSASAPSFNFGTANTGFYGSATEWDVSVGGVQVISGTAQAFSEIANNANAQVNCNRIDSSPAAHAICALTAQSSNSATTLTPFGQITFTSTTVTAGSELGSMALRVMGGQGTAGLQSTVLAITGNSTAATVLSNFTRGGVTIGGGTNEGDKTLNVASGIYSNNVLAVDSSDNGTFATLAATGHTTFEGVTSTGATGTGKLVYDTSAALVTPAIGAATGTSLALGGCTLSSYSWCTTGTAGNKNTATGGVSLSATLMDGVWNTAGTATTNFPQLFIQPSGTTAATAYSTAGTGLGINCPNTSAWAFDIYAAGAQKSSLSCNGVFTAAGVTSTSSSLGLTAASAGYVQFASRALLRSPADGVFSIRNQAETNTDTLSVPCATATPCLQLGAADVDTGPVAQTLRSQGTLAGGTSNVAGANWTFIASPGKGTGAGGSFIFQTTPAGSTGTVVGTPTTALTIDSTQKVTIGGTTISSSGSIVAAGAIQVSAGAGGLIPAANASSTQPTFIPNLADQKAGIGANASGNVSIIADNATVATEMIRVTGTTVAMPTIASSSAAQTGTVCWTTGTGNLTVDTTTTCLLSLEESKDVLGNIDPMKALGEEMKLKPFWFSYKRGTNQTDHAVHAGLGAHQVESVDKRLVGYDAKGKLQGVRYADSVTSLNVAAIKGLQAEILTLKAANDNLQKRLSKLEHRK